MKYFNLINLILATISTTGLMLISNFNLAKAGTLQFGSDGEVIAIDGLNIQGTDYDVTFHKDKSFNDLFGTFDLDSQGDPTFWNDANGANDATDSIMFALGDSNYTWKDDNHTTQSEWDLFLVPYFSNLTGAFRGVTDIGVQLNQDIRFDGGAQWNINQAPPSDGNIIWPIATFTPTAVPEPLTILASGIALGLGFLVNRKYSEE